MHRFLSKSWKSSTELHAQSASYRPVALCRHAAEELQQSLEGEQAHSHSLLLQLEQLEASRELPAGDHPDGNQRSSELQVKC